MGRALLRALAGSARQRGLEYISLSVERANPAAALYGNELRERGEDGPGDPAARGKGHGELARAGRQLGDHPEALRAQSA